jgi:hypothetical protein
MGGNPDSRVIAMKETARGGRREGAGRPNIEDRRVMRGLTFNSGEWETLKTQAAKYNLGVRAYIMLLAEKDAE